MKKLYSIFSIYFFHVKLFFSHDVSLYIIRKILYLIFDKSTVNQYYINDILTFDVIFFL